jgi:hypothetical protein
MEITKEMIEKELGCEINRFKLVPLYKNGECIGLSVNAEAKSRIEYLNIEIKLSKSGDFNYINNENSNEDLLKKWESLTSKSVRIEFDETGNPLRCILL